MTPQWFFRISVLFPVSMLRVGAMSSRNKRAMHKAKWWRDALRD
jgi:hypothetical protein